MTTAAPATSNISSATHSAGPQSTAPSAADSTLAASKYASTSASNASGPHIVSSAHNASVNQRASNMATPTIVNGNMPHGDHKSRPSVTISAAGASGHLPNGPSSATRPNISFGSINASASPSLQNSVPFQNQTGNLSTPSQNPRVLSPAASPSPIPQPAESGGRPPTGYQSSHGNGPVLFGSMGGPGGEMTNGVSGPPALNRQSSSASHADASTPTMPYGQPRGGNYNNMPQGGRGGRGPNNFNQNYAQQQQFTPGQGSFRPMNGQGRGGMSHQYQGQPMNPNSPHMQHRTPGPHGSPHMPNMQMNQGMPYLQPSYAGFQQQMQSHNGQFGGMHPQFDPNYGYYQNAYPMHPQYLQQGPPQSPRFTPGAPAYSPGQYKQQPGQMSRSPSQNPDQRPASAAPVPQPSPAAQQPSQTPAPQTPKPASSSFIIPEKKSKAITFKRPDGEVLDFTPAKKTPVPAAPVASPSPAPISAPTPVPEKTRTPSVAATDAKPAKTAEEIRATFLAQVTKDLASEKKADDVKIQADNDAAATKDKADADAKAAKEKDEAESKAAAEAKTAKDEEAAKQKAAAEKEAADKAAAQKEASDKEAADKEAAEKEASDKASADKAAAEKEASDKATAEKEAADKQAADKEIADKKDAEKAEAEKSAEAEAATSTAESSGESEADKKKREEDEEMERMIAEMEAQEKEEEERQQAYNEKKAKEKAEREAREKAGADEELKRQEREAEALEEKREKERAAKDGQTTESAEAKAEREALFNSLKKPEIGPGADAANAHPTIEEEPSTDDAVKPAEAKPKPGLKVETAKNEPAQATPGMQSLKTARMLDLTKETVNYPEGTKAADSKVIEGGKHAGKQYNIAFLLQFRPAYKEKPLLDWDQRVKDTMGDGDAKSARTPGPSSGRNGSQRGPPPPAFTGMGNFGSAPPGRTLPPGTTSADRFAASQRGGSTMTNPLAGVVGRGGFPMGQMPASGRGMTSASQSARGGPSNRGRGGGSQRQQSRTDPKQDKSMPLTANGPVKGLELSTSGWKATSIANPSLAVAVPDGHMAPDMVQRKVKAALNKMTPERFDKIADQILAISAQSKDESDGRTLRQVIQLTFDKACDEAHWASMYAKFCLRTMEEMSTEIKDANVVDKSGNPIVGGGLFRKYLLNRCQEEFERGWTVNLPEIKEGESEVMLSDEYYIAAAAKRKGLGLIQFIGELYKLRMLSIKIMHECFTRLLDFEGMPDEGAVESLTKLLRTVGATMAENEHGPALLDQYFQRIASIMRMAGLPSRLHFLLLDIVDLRKAGWRSKDDAKGPKTIQEIRTEAAQAAEAAERERLASKGNRPPPGRGDARYGNVPAQDFPRNQVTNDDLRRLGTRRQGSQPGGPARTLGPSSFGNLNSRSNSSRAGMGPGSSLLSESRTPSKRDEKKDETPSKSANAFDALMSLDNEDDAPTTSPTLTKSQPVAAASTEDAETATEEGAQEATGDADAAPAGVAQANE